MERHVALTETSEFQREDFDERELLEKLFAGDTRFAALQTGLFFASEVSDTSTWGQQ